MKRPAISASVAAIFSIALLVPPLEATWIEGGIELCTHQSAQFHHQVIPDGEGGVITCWTDDRNGVSDYEIFAQRFDRDGNVLWNADGVNISSLGSQQDEPVLASDGAGGAIIAYQSNRTGDNNIIAQRVRSDGTLAWVAGGLTVCGQSGNQYHTQIVSDGSGGAIITWSDSRSGDWDIYAARIDPTGVMPWTYNGVAVCQATGAQYSPDITTDGNHGAIITWVDSRAVDYDVYVQKIDQNGSCAWTSNGILMTSSSDDQEDPQIISDTSGGAIIVWRDRVTSLDGNIRAAKIVGNGTVAWGLGTGYAVCEDPGDQHGPVVVPDEAGGAFIAWTDQRSGEYDIYAQHLDYGGGMHWAEDGAPVCLAAGMQTGISIVPDGFGGAVILWTDYRYSYNNDVFGQNLDAAGNARWQEGGIDLTPLPSSQSYPEAIAADGGGFIAVWGDFRDIVDTKLYAQVFDRFGYWGDPAPVITGVDDVPGDQGGKVRITWSPARMDEYPGQTITHYTIWRSVEAPAAMAFPGEDAIVSSPCEIGLDFAGTAYRLDLEGAAAWEWVASVEAHYWEEYAYTCATLQDSTASNDGMLHFVISANTADQFVFWDSDPDSGWSVDNLAPCTPLALAGEQSYLPAGLVLSWAPNGETDLGGYKIYRGTDPTFDPEPDNMIATTCDTIVLDDCWTWDAGYCYKVAAVDIHGNESGYALLCSDQITGDDPAHVPDATFLAQNFPNPFNPATTIAFGLRERAHVSLRVYDAAGRLVATLLDKTRPAGRYTVEWDGSGAGGARAASGVYFYRLRAGTFEETRKMILLR